MLATLALPAGYELPALPRTRKVRARSADDLRHALRQAREHALNLDASGLDRVLRLDTQRAALEVQAATSWAALAAYPALHGRGLEAFGATPGLPATVGASVSRNAAGPDGLPVCAHVAAFTLVTPDGELRRADRDRNRELFGLALGGHGVFGVLYSVTLRLGSLQRSACHALAPAELSLPQERSAQRPVSAIECLLPPAALDRYLAEVRELARERSVALHAVSVRRYLPEEDSLLRWATREWAGVRLRFAVKSTLCASVGAAEIRRLLLGLALDRGGSFPIRDPRDATREQLEACYPMLGVFLREKRRCDPAERLHNDWFRQVRATLGRAQCEARWSR